MSPLLAAPDFPNRGGADAVLTGYNSRGRPVGEKFTDVSHISFVKDRPAMSAADGIAAVVAPVNHVVRVRAGIDVSPVHAAEMPVPARMARLGGRKRDAVDLLPDDTVGSVHPLSAWIPRAGVPAVDDRERPEFARSSRWTGRIDGDPFLHLTVLSHKSIIASAVQVSVPVPAATRIAARRQGSTRTEHGCNAPVTPLPGKAKEPARSGTYEQIIERSDTVRRMKLRCMADG